MTIEPKLMSESELRRAERDADDHIMLTSAQGRELLGHIAALTSELAAAECSQQIDRDRIAVLEMLERNRVTEVESRTADRIVKWLRALNDSGCNGAAELVECGEWKDPA